MRLNAAGLLCFSLGRVHRYVRTFIEILRLAVRREQLSEAPDAAPSPAPGAARRSLRTIFAREELPLDPEVSPAEPGRTPLRDLFRIEELALEPEAPRRPRRDDGLRPLFAAEPLPMDPPEEKRPRRSRWLAWLFAPEPIDPPQEH